MVVIKIALKIKQKFEITLLIVEFTTHKLEHEVLHFYFTEYNILPAEYKKEERLLQKVFILR